MEQDQTEMKQNEELGSYSSVHQIVIVKSPDHPATKTKSPKSQRGYYADNLAFVPDEEPFISRNAKDVYKNLSEPVPVPHRNGLISSGLIPSPSERKSLICRAILTGVLLFMLIALAFFFVSVQYIEPFTGEVYQLDSQSLSIDKVPPRLLSTAQPPPFAQPLQSKSDWRVEYDLPPGIPIVALQASEMNLMSPIKCPYERFALVLYLEATHSSLVENWFKECGSHVAYFRINGYPTNEDVDRLLVYFRDTRYLPLKAILKMSKGSSISENEEFIRTKNSDQVIRSVEMSGYVTPRTIEDIFNVAPYLEELTIKGDEVCLSLKRSLRVSCNALSWDVLQKLHIFQSKECQGMFDLIDKCWNMPSLETVQIRQTMITKKNAGLIKGILDKYNVKHVDFADNVCFDDILRIYPFMCQASS